MNAATRATAPARTPALANVVAAAPMNGEAVGDELTVVLDEVELEVEFVLETSVKLAQVKRVALLLWMTMDLSPKK